MSKHENKIQQRVWVYRSPFLSHTHTYGEYRAIASIHRIRSTRKDGHKIREKHVFGHASQPYTTLGWMFSDLCTYGLRPMMTKHFRLITGLELGSLYSARGFWHLQG
ncbi:hypothetical protein PHYBLDRAFT_139003 [Phycomyces blakesleeanus NRRL 1555(-)]|uniref:Uncharacterized protein n=1 Tax=Phycomyces blakesleeanus (strain ATCC 8743b / DSM 1359 / FGSC 10004 / NBRC 33097 / NRRL 1555) TaxID=763407 RepID=A0A163BGK1_PHYB8|nr:hypothetical protein PHYBLDRAFT_139003 [Phycomyces blakesleeanus NRRL 1555(-)]OAD81451.1 hypothetical protein PHYBLDRAFT_139003 [Phycomyces blakesleeanus NRRL 1555(-)]|eukprot:XP_018299491.1 hypothetical protein PHYBLDRAFT_139003 [Phycomyces blakesleeanus NRRL 1555(-)]